MSLVHKVWKCIECGRLATGYLSFQCHCGERIFKIVEVSKLGGHEMSLEKFSTEQLKEELEWRKRTPGGKPVMLEKPNFTNLQLCQSYIDEMANAGWADEDFREWIFEAAMMCFFGENVFVWTNEVRR